MSGIEFGTPQNSVVLARRYGLLSDQETLHVKYMYPFRHSISVIDNVPALCSCCWYSVCSVSVLELHAQSCLLMCMYGAKCCTGFWRLLVCKVLIEGIQMADISWVSAHDTRHPFVTKI